MRAGGERGVGRRKRDHTGDAEICELERRAGTQVHMGAAEYANDESIRLALQCLGDVDGEGTVPRALRPDKTVESRIVARLRLAAFTLAARQLEQVAARFRRGWAGGGESIALVFGDRVPALLADARH